MGKRAQLFSRLKRGISKPAFEIARFVDQIIALVELDIRHKATPARVCRRKRTASFAARPANTFNRRSDRNEGAVVKPAELN